jgi:hypothetical protein
MTTATAPARRAQRLIVCPAQGCYEHIPQHSRCAACEAAGRPPVALLAAPILVEPDLRRAASFAVRALRHGETVTVCEDHDDDLSQCRRGCKEGWSDELRPPENIREAVANFDRDERRVYDRVLICARNAARGDRWATSARRLADDLRRRPTNEKLRADARQWIAFRGRG